MPIKLKPVRVRDSLYILIPKTITQLYNISKDTTFILLVEKHENHLLLVLRTQHPSNQRIPRLESDQKSPAINLPTKQG